MTMMVSVCLATFNGEMFVIEQVKSILSQLQDGDEIVVSDDGSQDRTLSLIGSLSTKIRIVAVDRIGGVVPNFERAISTAKGDILVLCDQDDVWLPGRIELIRDALTRADLVVLNGQVVDVNLVPRGITVFESVNMRVGFVSNFIKNSFIGCCMAFRRDLRDRIIPFPKGVPWHDWYIGLVAELVGKVERSDVVTLLYRRHGANFSQTGEKSDHTLMQKIAMRWFVLRAVIIAVCRRKTLDRI